MGEYLASAPDGVEWSASRSGRFTEWQNIWVARWNHQSDREYAYVKGMLLSVL
jgi:hypothetical protein